MPRTVEELLSAARARLRRLTPAEAYDALAAGAVLVDVRGDLQRAGDGVAPLGG